MGLVFFVTTTTASPQLDPATLAAIRNSLAAAQQGRIGDACAIADKALEEGGDVVALNAMLGMLRGQAGDHDGAIRNLEIANDARPGDIRIATNLATALASAGRMEEAFRVAIPDLAFADPSLQLARIRGHIAQSLENPAPAVEAYEHVVAAAPQDWESWNNLGNARLMAGEVAEGIEALRRAATLNDGSLLIQLNLAKALRHSGDFGEAEKILEAAAALFPQDTQPLIDLHDLLKVSGRSDEEVLEVLELGVKRDKRNVELLLALARQHTLLLQMDQAEKAYRSVVAIDPANSEAFIGLATVHEHSRPAELDRLVDEAEKSSVDSGALHLLRAMSFRRARRYEEGLAALEQVPEELAPARREDLLGQFYEGLGRHDEAFAAFERMNEIQSADPSMPLLRSERLRTQLRERLARFDADWVKSWSAPPIEPELPSPVFLLGFPRSGTTLLDTMLMGHPDTAVMEERPVVGHVSKEIGSFEDLASLDEEGVRKAQGAYFEEARKYVDLASGQLIVDKSPLHLNSVAVIHRLFPNARYILALRHPADVLLSCYFSNFRLNPAMSNFVRLDTAAEFYDLSFQSWTRARELLPISVHEIHYEKLVEDPEGELKRLSETLGLAWDPAMLDHTATAAKRGVISTASYAQVTEPIYRRSVGRWRNYEKQLEPVLPLLMPWAKKFGYDL